jgi:predicted amidohydrolase YtcJ
MPAADLVFVNGTILTMNDSRPEVEAVAVKDGKIIFAGSRDSAMQYKADPTKLIDLEQHTLMPGFIDPHSHFTQTGGIKMMANLSPAPYGTVMDIPSLQECLRQYITDNKIPAGQTVLGFGYDDAIMKEHRHPVKEELDAVSTEYPIYILHASGHMGVANSKALSQVGITPATPNPEGGVIVHNADGSLNGRLEENANIYLAGKLEVAPTPEEVMKNMMAAQEDYLKYGQTTICDGRSMPGDLKVLSLLATKKLLKVDVVAFPDYDQHANLLDSLKQYNVYQNRFRIGGMKFTVDGSPQGRTAWLTQPYFHPGEGKSKDYKGFPIYTDAALYEKIKAVLQHGMTFQLHDNGDAAIDQALGAILRLKEEGIYQDSMRATLIHVQVSRPDHIAKIKQAGVIPSYYVSHTYFWGDWHRQETLGEQRAAFISPCKAALDAGILFTLSHDAPVTPPDIITLFHTAVNRTTMSGYVLGPDQRIKVWDALKAITINAAYQYKEEHTKGSIETGKLADLIVLDQDPLQINPSLLKDLKVLHTYKEGELVYSLK